MFSVASNTLWSDFFSPLQTGEGPLEVDENDRGVIGKRMHASAMDNRKS